MAMTHPDTPDTHPPELSWKTLLVLAVAMPAVGNLLTMAALYLHRLSVRECRTSQPGVHVDCAYFIPTPGGMWLTYFWIGLWLNVVGAVVLMAFRFIWRHLKRS